VSDSDSSSELTPGALFAGVYRITGPADPRHSFSLYPAERERPQQRITLLMVEPGLLRDEASWERLYNVTVELDAMNGAPYVIDGRVEGGRAWLTFKVPRGEVLLDVLARGPMSEADAQRALSSIASTMTAMHDANLLHGDLSTRNIWFDPSPCRASATTLSVPGLGPLLRSARRLHPIDGPVQPKDTFAHLAPEVIKDSPEDLAADVWSFALLAYELLTGAPYWVSMREGASTIALVSEIVWGVLAPASERATQAPRPQGLPPGFDAWFARCLSREPEARPSMREAAGGFLALFERAPVELPRQPRVILGNPKGSFYDRGLGGPIDDILVTPPVKPEIILGNPKGSFYDRGLSERPRRWPYLLAFVLLVLVGGALGAWLAAR